MTLLAAGLGGCVAVWGAGHKVTHQDSRSIVIESDPGYVGARGVQFIADQHCRASGSMAVLQSERRTLGGIDVRGYQCTVKPEAQTSSLALAREALERLKAKDWARAAELAGAAIEAGSLTVTQAAATYTIRGFCRYAQGRIGEAQADIDRALQLRPNFKPALELKAVLREVRAAQRSAPRRPRPPGDEPEPPVIQF